MNTMGASCEGLDWPGTEYVNYRGAIGPANVSDSTVSAGMQHSMKFNVIYNASGDTSFMVELEKPAAVKLNVYDIHGRRIWSYNGNDPRTKYRIDANNINFSNGFYLVSVQQQNEILTRKFMIVN